MAIRIGISPTGVGAILLVCGGILFAWASTIPVHHDPEAAGQFASQFHVASCAELDAAYREMRAYRTFRWQLYDLGLGLAMAGGGFLLACGVFRLRHWHQFDGLPTPPRAGWHNALSILLWILLVAAIGIDAWTEIRRDDIRSISCGDNDLWANSLGTVVLLWMTPLATQFVSGSDAFRLKA